MNECVRAVCDLLSDVLTVGWNKKGLGQFGYSVRSLCEDVLVEIVWKDQGLDKVSYVLKFSGALFFRSFTMDECNEVSLQGFLRGCCFRRTHDGRVVVARVRVPR